MSIKLFTENEKEKMVESSMAVLFITEYLKKYRPDIIVKSKDFAKQIMVETTGYDLFEEMGSYMMRQVTFGAEKTDISGWIKENYGIDVKEMIKE